MDKDEALKLALEFIERVNRDGWILADFEPEMYSTITAIKEALAQLDQESDDLTIAYMSGFHDGKNKDAPQRKPLTDEQIFDLSEPFGAFQYGDAQGHKRLEFARAIEAAHGIKE